MEIVQWNIGNMRLMVETRMDENGYFVMDVL